MGPEKRVQRLEQSQDHHHHAADTVSVSDKANVLKDVKTDQGNDPTYKGTQQTKHLDGPVELEPRSVGEVLIEFGHHSARGEQEAPSY
mmetsp:Transcript_593/g.1355  ORF Transcript_593/g.1355 Transcript_593/m.1355 type:complete len:88 (-) Transcript_593:199-462(-)